MAFCCRRNCCHILRLAFDGFAFSWLQGIVEGQRRLRSVIDTSATMVGVTSRLHSLTDSRPSRRFHRLPSICHNFSVCGRYRLSRRKQVVEEYFGSVSDEQDWEPRYNIAPTQPVPVIRQNSTQPVRELSLMHWGLIPSWAKDRSGAASMINARSETASTKPAFADALKFRRCLIPADGFYEWKRSAGSKQPFCFEFNNGELFAFAGLWDRWPTRAVAGSPLARY